MNQLAISIILIMFPGILAAVISDKITVHSKWAPFRFGLYALIMGMSTYCLLQAIVYALNIFDILQEGIAPWMQLKIWSVLLDAPKSLPALEILLSTALSVPIAFLAAYLVNYKIFNRIAQRMKISTKYGDENLYSFYLNSEEVDWVYVRDFENKLTYFGRIATLSEKENLQEMVLSDVEVYSLEESQLLYEINSVYLAKQNGHFVIEAAHGK